MQTSEGAPHKRVGCAVRGREREKRREREREEGEKKKEIKRVGF